MYPYYGRYGSSFGLGISNVSGPYLEETHTYPEFHVHFHCSNKAFSPEILLREVGAEEMKLLVKDLKGGLQVEKILDNSPNRSSIHVGHVIAKVNNVRIDEVSKILRAFECELKGVPVEIIREGVRKIVILKSLDVTDLILKAQVEIVRSTCQKNEIQTRSLCSHIGELKEGVPPF